ncbi:MAG: MBOAT family protein [Muribaculaceae bacterium]|nr:MBOAT family protein [Muribaculaceae bacterium]
MTAYTYLSGILVNKYGVRTCRSKWILWLNVAADIGILGVFKYFNFFSNNFAALMGYIGWQVDAVTLDWVLPLGISFYTFQALGYIIDVYRGTLRGTRDCIAFMLFISFFPQVIAGPIERATNLLPQFLRNRKFDYSLSVSGMKLILWGLFKKMVVADNAAPVVSYVLGSYESQGTLALWIGALLLTFQVYCDFSGYSDMAIGVSRLFGIRLCQNFDKPLLAKGIRDFWHRWHISLSTWFRDYVYFPLGGSRKGVGRTISNTMTVFLLSGLWHGPSWTYVAWGAYNGVLTLPGIIRSVKAKEKGVKLQKESRLGILRPVLLMGLAFFICIIGRTIFRIENIEDTFRYIGHMFVWVPGPTVGRWALMWTAILLVCELLTRKSETPFSFNNGLFAHCRPLRWGIYLITFIIVLIFAGPSATFIYFQF